MANIPRFFVPGFHYVRNNILILDPDTDPVTIDEDKINLSDDTQLEEKDNNLNLAHLKGIHGFFFKN